MSMGLAANISSINLIPSWQETLVTIEYNQTLLFNDESLISFNPNSHLYVTPDGTIRLKEKSVGLVIEEKILTPTIDAVISLSKSFFNFMGNSFNYFNQAFSFPPGADAFKWKDLDPTNKNSAVSKGLRQLDPTNKNSAVASGLKELDPFNKNSATGKGLRKLGKHIEAGGNNIVKVVTGEHKISPKGIEKAIKKAGKDIEEQWDRMPPEGKAIVIIAAAAAAGYGAAYLISHGTVFSLGVSTSNGVFVEVLTYSTAGGLEVFPALTGGALSAAAWVNFYDELNKDDSTRAFEERGMSSISIDEIDHEESENIINTDNDECNSKDIEITFEDGEKLPIQLFDELSKKPDLPSEPAWLEPDHPIRQMMPNIPAGGDSHQRRIIRRQADRLARAFNTDFGKSMVSGKNSVPVQAARALSILGVINDFIKIPIETRKAAHSFLRQAMVNEYGGCDYPVISGESYDSNAACAAEKQASARKNAAEMLESLKDHIANKNPEFAKRWEEAKNKDHSRMEEVIEDTASYFP